MEARKAREKVTCDRHNVVVGSRLSVPLGSAKTEGFLQLLLVFEVAIWHLKQCVIFSPRDPWHRVTGVSVNLFFCVASWRTAPRPSRRRGSRGLSRTRAPAALAPNPAGWPRGGVTATVCRWLPSAAFGRNRNQVVRRHTCPCEGRGLHRLTQPGLRPEPRFPLAKTPRAPRRSSQTPSLPWRSWRLGARHKSFGYRDLPHAAGIIRRCFSVVAN